MARILVIDGDVCLRNALRDILEQEGYNVVEAHNDYEGLTRDQASPWATPSSISSPFNAAAPPATSRQPLPCKRARATRTRVWML